MKKKPLKNFSFYAIIDYKTLKGRNILKTANRLILGGADIIQLRFKNTALSKVIQDALRISRLAKKHNTIFIINNRLDIALLSRADGVHLGQEDVPVRLARRMLGKDKIIGVSCHSLSQLLKAQNEKADYLSVGPIFSTPTKPQYKPVGLGLLKKAKKKIKIPYLAIGGINLSNLEEVLNAGAKGVAVVRAACCAGDIPGTIKKFKRIMPNPPTADGLSSLKTISLA
ncbi:MAG: thiamine phosphate synthase [Candidatus Omnitrophica bacterium CG11_big_fil_rev_8_21_14_0_20_42_13]|uniref:Thiamine-phosphate synthase n=1 Tax=Candidatus Ghiorseimicrobium undicola TaxID=1974746 RepID=A0A2H0M014_9BACT|nr:MAG: thiamine phosphate synthase [Candidatus Omnitrophica bacterium CG11_big_fil_rev_8_21_14_0_20_42_13]